MIHDFSQAQGDRINVLPIDADLTSPGPNAAFDWIGSAGFSGSAGELRYQQFGNSWTMIYGDQDGDAVADILIQLAGIHDLTSGDFVL